MLFKTLIRFGMALFVMLALTGVARADIPSDDPEDGGCSVTSTAPKGDLALLAALTLPLMVLARRRR